ncbi:FAD-dependent oxidoreductase [Streptomyces sp. NEAU-H22]|uniref:FAD-dependent oxidoreductase n=1 Tax=Streptomyces sp. NEAU-H22 TaxID=2994655 RepID=UPI00225C408A|nr:FAD-dependent oxidoreductase [Streptomyces sp. NEAU-H22]MCX3292339.1 FAD-dependent oxidoreductase [Streptomyces sp. NEAU-H22]
MDAQLAVIGLGSIGSMALWQASRLSGSVVGFEAATPAHGRSAVGGDTRLFRMIYLGRPEYYPIIERSRGLWAELEAETGQQDILTPTGGLSIGTANGSYINSLLEATRITGAEHYLLSREELAERYPQHNLRPDDCAVYDPHGGVLRTDRAVSAAVAAAQANGAIVLRNTPVDGITETDHGVVVTSGDRTWTFEKVIVASGGWSRRLVPDHLKAVTETHRIVLTWFIAQDGTQFSPENFPAFSRWYEDRSMYGAPAVDGVTVKASVDGPVAGCARATPDPDAVPRELTREEVEKVTDIVTEFFPGLIPTIARSDAFPDLFTVDRHPLVGWLDENSRIYCATGFSGKGFKMATGYGHIAAHEALGKQTMEGLDFVRPDRFKTG